MAKRRVVITGAAGYVVQRMWSELSQRWDVVPIDVRANANVPGMVTAWPRRRITGVVRGWRRDGRYRPLR